MFEIQDIINTLNSIEVKGKENLDRLLGAIMALELVRDAQEKTEVIGENNGEQEHIATDSGK